MGGAVVPDEPRADRALGVIRLWMRRSFAQDIDVLLRRLCGFLIRQRRAVLLLALLLSLIGAYFAARLYQNLHSEIEELLPVNAPSVVAAKELGPQLHTVTHLSIVLEGSDPDAMERFADSLTARLNSLPRSFIERVDYRTDEEEAFLRRFGLLFLSVEDLTLILQRIKARIAWEKQRANPLLSLVEDEGQAPAPPLELGDIGGKYSRQEGDLSRFRNGYFQTPDGKLLAILVRPPESATGYEKNRALWDGVKAEIEGLRPNAFDRQLKIGFDGEVATLVEEQEALVADLASSTVIVIVFVLLALWIYFRRWAALAAIFGSLAVGCAVTFGLSYFLVGHLNANTAFLGSIVVGNGINVAIIIVARYVEERRGGLPVDIAVNVALRRTLAATFIAAFASGLAYLSLTVTDFRGFRHFGIIGGLGMALCWISAVLLLPPLLSTTEAWRELRLASQRSRPVSSWIVRLVQQHRIAIRVASVLSLVAAAAGVASYRGELIEHDVTHLRSKRSRANGSIYWARKVDEIFRAYLTPVVVVGKSPGDLDRVVATLNQRRRELGDLDPFREVRTIRTVIPDRQAEKIPLLRELRTTLTEARLSLLSPEQRRMVEKFRPPEDIRPVTIEDLPHSVRIPLTERDGTVGRVGLAFPRKVGNLSSHETEELADLVRGSIADSGAEAMAVGQGLLFADITSAIVKDGPVATGLAFLLVLFLVLMVFRHLRPAWSVISGLLLGVAWLVGIAAAFRVRVNFLNFVVLPITFGIGVDYAVNIIQRYRLEGRGSLAHVLRETGGAVALCSSTTIIGYSSLVVADNQALSGFGLLASLGELSCITAALIALPAFLLGPKA